MWSDRASIDILESMEHEEVREAWKTVQKAALSWNRATGRSVAVVWQERDDNRNVILTRRMLDGLDVPNDAPPIIRESENGVTY